MSAGNAFAGARNSASVGVEGEQNGDNEQHRPLKRQRTSETLVPSIWLPSAQSETSLEVDIMILDFLAFQATTACLNSRKPEDNRAPRSSLELVESFTNIFKARHAQYWPDAELRLRLLLLKMATLFTQRFTLNPTTPDRRSLEKLRSINRQRAEVWMEASSKRTPSQPPHSKTSLEHVELSIDQLERNRAHVLHDLGMPAEDEDYEDAFYGTAQSLALLDLLPLFVELSAASSSIHGSALTPRWMHLACDFMLQACLEQYLVRGAVGSDVLDQAFAWGYLEDSQDDELTAKAQRGAEVNEMFEDDDYATEVEGWQTLKLEYVRELVDVPDRGSDGELDVVSQLESTAVRHPIAAFEASILKFLDALSVSISQPVLTQLEKGQLDGMSEDETKAFLVHCGVGPSLP